MMLNRPELSPSADPDRTAAPPVAGRRAGGVVLPRGMATATRARVRDHCLAPERVDAPLGEGGRYGRMFDLPPLEADESRLEQLGVAGGFCDGGDCEAEADLEAGWPFFGQYIAHDLTADRSPLRSHSDLGALRNMRSPRANLESLYGGGPVGSPYMYMRDDPAKLLLVGGDLPRNPEGVALIGDPRNDVHLFVTELQISFAGAHNRLVDRLREDGIPEGALFDEARRALAWHYQWLVVNDFLPGLVGQRLVGELQRSGPRFYRPEGEPFIPVEFADAAYRYGHSQIRQLYQLVEGGPSYPVFPDLIGFRPLDRRRVDWALLFDVRGRPPAQRAKRIDGLLPTSLIQLPEAIVGDVDRPSYRSLATRDLERGQGTGLPSGEAVARLVGAEVLSSEELGLDRAGWTAEAPLWLYVLREAAVRENGERLGEVGGRIVAEVLYGLIQADPESYLAVESEWVPTLPSRDGTFGLVDVLVPVE
jgi:Animal haem peroxidase